MCSKVNIFTILILSTIIGFSGSCSPKIHPTAGTDVKDSVRTEIRTEYRDTTIYVHLPDESVDNKTTDTTSHLETSIAESDARIVNGVLYHSLRNKNTKLPALVQLPMQYVTTDYLRLVTNRVVVEVEKDLSWWQETLMIIGAATTLYVILRLVIRRFILKK